MTSLNNKARNEILSMMSDETKMLTAKANERAQTEWEAAEQEVAEREGMSDALTRARHLEEQIQAMQRELFDLLHSHPWRVEEPTDAEYVQAGFGAPYRDARGRINQSLIPDIFGHAIKTRWDLEVFKLLDKRMNIRSVHRIIKDVGQAVRRDLLLAGTYEDARIAYNRFYQLLRKAGGAEVPALLSEITDMPLLLPKKEG